MYFAINFFIISLSSIRLIIDHDCIKKTGGPAIVDLFGKSNKDSLNEDLLITDQFRWLFSESRFGTLRNPFLKNCLSKNTNTYVPDERILRKYFLKI